jgi:hypothetical protein
MEVRVVIEGELRNIGVRGCQTGESTSLSKQLRHQVSPPVDISCNIGYIFIARPSPPSIFTESYRRLLGEKLNHEATTR